MRFPRPGGWALARQGLDWLTPNAAALFAVDNIGNRDYQQPLGLFALRRSRGVACHVLIEAVNGHGRPDPART